MAGDKVNTHFQNGNLSTGNTITVTNVRFSQHGASVDNGNELTIGENFTDIQTNRRPTGTTPPPSAIPFFREVREKNQQLVTEENNLIALAAELLETINKNKKVIQEAQVLGLELAEIPADVLNYFQVEFFTQLEENIPLDSLRNTRINQINEKVRQKKLNIKNNINRTYDNNNKKLTDKRQERQNHSSSLPPENELEKLKKQVITKVNKVLMDKNNLRNIDLVALAGGQYQEWENAIEKLTSNEEVAVYGETLLAVLKEAGAKERQAEEEQEKDNAISQSTSPLNSSTNNIKNIKKAINNLPLTSAKNMAKNKIIQLFNNYRPNIEKIKEVWKGKESWMAYLESCNSSEQVVSFLEKLEQAITQSSQSQEDKKRKKLDSLPSNNWIIFFLITSLIILVGLLAMAKHYKKKK